MVMVLPLISWRTDVFTYGQSRDNQNFQINGLPNFLRYGALLLEV